MRFVNNDKMIDSSLLEAPEKNAGITKRPFSTCIASRNILLALRSTSSFLISSSNLLMSSTTYLPFCSTAPISCIKLSNSILMSSVIES